MGGLHTLTIQGHSSFDWKYQGFFCCKNMCVSLLLVFFFLLYHFSPFAAAHKQYSRLIWTWKLHFQLMDPRSCRLIPSGKMKELQNLIWHCTDLLFCLCLFLCGSYPGVFFRVLGWHQARMLDEGRDPLEVFPQAVYLSEGHKLQPVLSYHHPASGTWKDSNASPPFIELLRQPKRHKPLSFFILLLFCYPAAVHSANHRRGRHSGLLSFWSVFIS